MKSYFDLTGQVAVVTGCSTGLGVQMAHALANPPWPRSSTTPMGWRP